MLKYLATIGVLGLLAGELFLFVKIISKYRRRYVPLATLTIIFAFNIALSYGLLYLSAKFMPPAVAVTAPQSAK